MPKNRRRRTSSFPEIGRVVRRLHRESQLAHGRPATEYRIRKALLTLQKRLVSAGGKPAASHGTLRERARAERGGDIISAIDRIRKGRRR